jgi:spore coat protein CotH
VERFAGYIAGSVMCANWDGFGQNHFLSFTSTPAGRFAVVPWDLDHTWGYGYRWMEP